MRPTHSYLAVAVLGLTASLIGCEDPTGPREQSRGSIEITVATEAVDVDGDPDGYTLSVDGRLTRSIGINSSISIGPLTSGTHVVRLDGVAPHCSVRGDNPVSVNVVGGRALVPVFFSVWCYGPGGGPSPWDY